MMTVWHNPWRQCTNIRIVHCNYNDGLARMTFLKLLFSLLFLQNAKCVSNSSISGFHMTIKQVFCLCTVKINRHTFSCIHMNVFYIMQRALCKC